MSNKQALPPMSFAGLADWEPYEGGGAHGLVPQEGLYEVKITALEPEMAKDGIKALVKVSCSVVDTDVGTGTPLISRVIYFGVDGKGNNLNRQFAAFLNSVGITKEQIQGWAKTASSFPIEALVQQLVNRSGFVQIAFEPYNGQIQSNIKNWVEKSVYTKAKENNAHRGRKLEQVNVQALIAAQAQGTTGTVAGGAPAFGGAPALGGAPSFAAGFAGAPALGGAPMAQAGAPAANSNAMIPTL